ncbi:MAG TPA: molybdenum ABC transporter ATP-binding protein [Rhizobiaceae bacterium]|nr:molybdenum ABC transporter ATP-binding protein [Rhizobiaceae bacterium]
MTLEVDVRHKAGAFRLDARFESAGRLTALFGPSGSGKTTVVNLIAGLARPDDGRIAVDGAVLVDTAKNIFVPAHKRRVGYVFQDARLFPHLSVRSNLAYGRWFTPRGERTAGFEKIVDLLGIAKLLDRRPHNLSGGEKQRVAIGRALLANPAILLMDEPLASLDDARKAEIVPYIERLRDGMKLPIVYVSHSIAEVARLATDIVVLADGKIAAAGTASDILRRSHLFAGAERGEAGAIVDARVLRHDETFGMTVLTSKAGEIRVPRIEASLGSPLRLRIRARDVMIATEKPVGLSALNMFPGTVREIGEAKGPAADVNIDCGGELIVARITRQSLATLKLERGSKVYAVVKTVAFDDDNLPASALERAESL